MRRLPTFFRFLSKPAVSSEVEINSPGKKERSAGESPHAPRKWVALPRRHTEDPSLNLNMRQFCSRRPKRKADDEAGTDVPFAFGFQGTAMGVDDAAAK